MPAYNSTRESPVNTAPQPVAAIPFMHVWRDAVWAARNIGPIDKLVLLCVGRFVDPNGGGCSMSYRQIAADCCIAERTAKRVVSALDEIWVGIKAKQGRYIKGKGRENLYSVTAPDEAMEAARQARLAQLQAQIGVILRHPAQATGVSQSHTNKDTDYQSYPVSKGSCGWENAGGADATRNWAAQMMGGVQ
jgi:hypothetical protein